MDPSFFVDSYSSTEIWRKLAVTWFGQFYDAALSMAQYESSKKRYTHNSAAPNLDDSRGREQWGSHP